MSGVQFPTYSQSLTGTVQFGSGISFDCTNGIITANNITGQVTATGGFDPWNPPTTAAAKGARTLTTDYTFGTNTTSLQGAAPITNIAQLNNSFWSMITFTVPISQNNGAVTHQWANSEWQTYNGTTNMSFNATDLQIQAVLNPAINNNTKLGNLFQTSTTSVNITGAGAYTWTIATGLDWANGDPVNVDGSGGGAGTITSYTAGTGVLVVNLTTINYTGSGTTWRIVRAMITSGVIRPKSTFLYGFVEASIWFPPGNGMSGALFLLPDNNLLFGNTFSEIDIIEQITNSAKNVDGTWASAAVHGDGQQIALSVPYFDMRTGGQLNSSYATGPLLYHLGFDLTAGFHKFQCLWVPGYCVFYVDDMPISVLSQPWKTAQGEQVGPANLIYNLAISNGGINFCGLPNSIADFPANMRCQYIRVWQSAAELALGTSWASLALLNQLTGGAGLSGSGAWNDTGNGSVLTFNQAVDPTGASHAAMIREDATNLGSPGHSIHQVVNIVAGQNYTLSINVKVGSSGTRNIELVFGDLFFFYWIQAVFNPSTGAMVLTTPHNGATVVATGSSSLGSGWFQVYLTANLPATANANVYFGLANGTSDSYAGDNTSNLLLYNPRLLQGNSP